MPSTCGVCNTAVTGKSVGEVLVCSGECKRSFHINCVKDDNEYRKTRSTVGKQWCCKDCRSVSSSQGSGSSGVSTDLTKEFIVNLFDSFKSEVFEELKQFRGEITEITKSLQFLSDKTDKANSLMEDLKKEIKSIKKENEAQRIKNEALNSTVSELQERVRTLEQYTRRSNIEISGIPETPRENVIAVVKDVGAVLGVAVEEAQINAAHRVPSYRSDRAPSLVVQFNSRQVRDSWIEKFKANRANATAEKVNSSFNKNNFYVNEHLSPVNKLFLAKLKKKCKEIGYEYVWCREGKFFIRKRNGEKCRRIETEADIDSLK